jgi:hypothetical protein
MKLTKSDFQIGTLEDELRVDGLCRELLMTFYHERIASGVSEHDATLLANSADLFLRDYLIGVRQLNLLESDPDVVRKFAGNWYIVNTMEPVIEEIAAHLAGIREFYLFLHSIEAIDAEFHGAVEQDCADLTYYQSRIDSFWEIKGDGYLEWERECSLK